MRLSVIVPAFNEERELPGALAAIRRSLDAVHTLGWQSELIVCDNNSTDRTADIAREAGATVVFEPVNQISRARNAGAAAATGEWLVFVDADSYPTPGLFAEMAAAIRTGDVMAGGSTVRVESDHPAARFAVGLWNAISRAARWAAGSFIFCDAVVFREAGGFSERLYASEEIDLFRRLKRLARASGRRIVILDSHPLLTSDRKAHLYTPREGLTFVVRTIMTGGRTLRRREDCQQWYDGRR